MSNSKVDKKESYSKPVRRIVLSSDDEDCVDDNATLPLSEDANISDGHAVSSLVQVKKKQKREFAIGETELESSYSLRDSPSNSSNSASSDYYPQELGEVNPEEANVSTCCNHWVFQDIQGVDMAQIPCDAITMVAHLFRPGRTHCYFTLRALNSTEFFKGFDIVASDLPSVAQPNSTVYILRFCINSQAIQECGAEYAGRIACAVLNALRHMYRDSVTIMTSKDIIFSFAKQGCVANEDMAKLFGMGMTEKEKGKKSSIVHLPREPRPLPSPETVLAKDGGNRKVKITTEERYRWYFTRRIEIAADGHPPLDFWDRSPNMMLTAEDQTRRTHDIYHSCKADWIKWLKASEARKVPKEIILQLIMFRKIADKKGALCSAYVSNRMSTTV